MRQVDSNHIMLTYQAIGFSDKPPTMKFMLFKMKIFPKNNRSLELYQKSMKGVNKY